MERTIVLTNLLNSLIQLRAVCKSHQMLIDVDEQIRITFEKIKATVAKQ